MKLNKGFTLIELLVVIAIIGILSSVVLASLNSARSRGTDAAIKTELSGMRAEAELVADGGSYENVCSTGSAKDMYDAALSKSADGDCAATSTAWAAEVQLTSSTGYFCVDSTGAATTTTGSTIDSAGNADTACGT